MESTSLIATIVLFIIVGYALYTGVKTFKKPYQRLVDQEPISLYEKLINEGIRLSDDLVNCRYKLPQDAMKAYRRLNQWDEKVQHLTRFKVVQ